MANRFDKLFEEADDAFNGKYAEELKKLSFLNEEQVNSITPNEENVETYNVLMKVVEEASRENLSQAQLAKNIKKLGSVAVKLAMKVPSLASLL